MAKFVCACTVNTEYEGALAFSNIKTAIKPLSPLSSTIKRKHAEN